jgi:DegV family protein with EDD domain
MSSSCNSVRLGAQAIDYEDHVYVVDSKNLCSGIGMLLLYAAELAEAGESAAVIAEKSRALAERVRSSFIIDTLDFLAKGGRCSSATAVVGNALKIKPRIIVKDGAMSVDKKYRGDQKVVAKHYVKDLKKELLAADPRCVFLVRAGLPEEIFEEAVKTVTDLKHFEHILTAEAGAIISSHCGPGTLGVFYVEKA